MHIHAIKYFQEVIKINLRENGFNFVQKLHKNFKLNIEIKEVPVDYYGRTVEEGKIQFFDGFRAIYCLFKYRLLIKC